MSSPLELPPVLHDAPLPAASVDLSGRIFDANEALLSAGGYTLDELRGRLVFDLLDPDGAADARACFSALVSGQGPMYRAERRYPAKDGVVHDVQVTVSLVREEGGAPAGCLALITDLSEHKKALREAVRKAAELEAERERLLLEVQNAQAHLQATSRMKDEFVATLSHELRTPLNAVLGWARILRTRPLGEQTAHAVAVIERNALAQARLIDDLLDLSRIITGKTRLTLAEVDVRSIGSEAVESLRPAAEGKGIVLTLQIEDNLPRVMADSHRLQQILWNLLSNAIKFTEAGGRVALAIRSDERNIVAEVTDTGIGVSPDVLPKVFDRFIQGDSSSTRAHSGLGLGLAIVRYLVELHGGTVQAQSAGPGKGATFGFTLPRRG